MHFLKKILDFYIFSNIHVALAGFCLTKITLFEFGIEDSLVPVFVLLSIIISYNLIRFFEIKANSLNWFKNWFLTHKKALFSLSVLSTFSLGYIIFFSSFNLSSLVVLFPFAFMTLFYVVPLFKIGKIEVSFRNFPFVKIFSIAISWAGITVFFPIYEAGFEITSSVYIEFIQRILFLIAITIPFDIRDVNIDPKSLKTLPQVLGVSRAKFVSYVMLLLFVFLEFYRKDYSNLDFYIVIVIAIISSLFLGFSSPGRTRYYTGFWVESIPIIWFGFIILFLNK